MPSARFFYEQPQQEQVSTSSAKDFALESDRIFNSVNNEDLRNSMISTKYAHQLGLEADESKYQRAYKDLLKAGLNPRLLLEGGSANASGVNASSSYNASSNKSNNVSTNIGVNAAAIASLLITILLMAA